MRLREPRILAGRFSRAERRKRRANIILEDASLSSATKTRYFMALQKLMPLLEKVTVDHDMDEVVCQWVELCWKSGEPLLTVGDGLSALHFYQPWTRRRLPHSWKLFRTWRRIEIPARAPPLTQLLVRSMASFELSNGNLEMAAMLLTSFHCLLRTGEALKMTGTDLVLGKASGILKLRNTKTSQRFSANEAISITDPLVIDVLSTLVEIRKELRCLEAPIWRASAQLFRNRFKELIIAYGLERHQFRPYSLRRGGATHLFQTTHSMETTLTRGRWESSKVAKVYISDALSYLPNLRATKQTKALLKKFFLVSPSIG